MKIVSKTVKMTAIAMAAAGIFAFTNFGGGGIKGTVSPAENASAVTAISGTDTVKAAVVSGSFDLANAKAGTYVVTIQAVAPYKSAVREGVVVSDDQVIDLGNIVLEK